LAEDIPVRASPAIATRADSNRGRDRAPNR